MSEDADDTVIIHSNVCLRQTLLFLFLGVKINMKKIIELKGVSKSFDGEVVLDNIDLDIYDNEFLTLLGPSGCGKTTTLRNNRRI